MGAEELRLKLAGLTRRSFVSDVLKEAQSFEIKVERIDAYIGMIYLYIKSQKQFRLMYYQRGKKFVQQKQ